MAIARAMKTSLGFLDHLPSSRSLQSPFLLFGTEEEIAQDLVDRRERFGISYFTVFEPPWSRSLP